MNVIVRGMSPYKGGTESFILGYTSNLEKNGIHFDFLCNSKPAYQAEIEKMGGKIFLITAKHDNYIKYRNDIKRFFKNNARNYDMIWDNVGSLSNIDYLKYAKKYKIRYRIIHSHGSKNMGNWRAGLLHYINKFKVKLYATDFWACSNLAGKYFYKPSIQKSDKYRIIHNAIDIDKYVFSTETRENIRSILHIQDKFVIGHVGRFSFEKNHEFLINIFAKIQNRIPKSALLLIGEGVLENDIKEKVKKLGLNNVYFLGVKSNVQDYLQAMDVFILPSFFEGLPIVAIESQAVGLKTYVSDCISSELKITEYLLFKNLKNGANAWASDITHWANGYERKDMRSVMCEAGYDIETETKKLDDILSMEYSGE